MNNQHPAATGTRDRILEAAARLFHQQGFEATSVAVILRDAGVNSGSLYHFFPSKEALLAGVLKRHLERLGPTILDPVEEVCTDPVERIFKLLELYRTGLRVTECTQGCPIGNLALEMGNRNPEIQELLEQYFSGWTERVHLWLQQAGERLPVDLDRGSLARFILSVMEGGVMQARAIGRLDPLDASVAQLRSHLELLAERAHGEGRADVSQATRSKPTRRRRMALWSDVPEVEEPAEEQAAVDWGAVPVSGREDVPTLAEPEPSEDSPATTRPGWRTW